MSHPRVDAARWVRLCRNPSVHIYQALRTTLEKASASWVTCFLELGGLEALLGTLEKLAEHGHGFSSFSDAILQLDCLACIREVLNMERGMSHMAAAAGNVLKLVRGLNTQSPLAKKHMFELLTAVGVYSSQAYHHLLQAFNCNKKEWVYPSRFSVILSEFDEADTVGYRTTLMGFINAIISSCSSIRQRNSIRNEFISLQLLDILHHLRKEDKDAELSVQIQSFMTQKHTDELRLNGSLDVNSQQELFQTIHQKLLGTQESVHFLSMLQDLMWMYNTELQSPCKWDLIANVVHQVACLATEADVEEFSSMLKNMNPDLKKESQAAIVKDNKDLQEVLDSTLKEDIVAGAPGMDSGISLNSHQSDGSGFHRQGSGRRSGQRSAGMPRLKEETRTSSEAKVPKQPLQNLKWVKVAPKAAKSESSIWSGRVDQEWSLDYDHLESQFPEGHAIRDADDEVELLSSDQSLSLNLFLSRIDPSAEELVAYIEDVDEAAVGRSTLRYLMGCLPSEQEMEQLRGFQGERYDLGQAEQFLLMLSDVTNYRTLLEAMSYRAELCSKFEGLKSTLVAQIATCGDVLHNKGLRKFLRLVLQAGNFLNYKSIFHNAAGFQMSSLDRLSSVKSSDPWNDLLTHLIEVAIKKDDEAMSFVKEMPNLGKAIRSSLTELKDQITELNAQFSKLHQKVSSADSKCKAKLDMPMEDAKKDIKYLQDKVQQASGYSHQMAVYFCEDLEKFDLQTCLTHLSYFCDSIKTVLKEQGQLKTERKLAMQRRSELALKHTETTAATHFGSQAVACSSFILPKKERVVEDLLSGVQSGNIQPLSSDPDSPLTPGNEDNSLLISRIVPVASTPSAKQHFVVTPSSSLENVLDLTAVTLKGNNSVVENPSSKAHGLVPGVRIYQKTGQSKKGHRRTNSDLNTSANPAQKWTLYEQIQARPAAVPDSHCPLASLGLEKMGQTLSLDEIQFMQAADVIPNMPDEEPKEKSKKRSSLGFFRRLSRRVLRTRNSDSNSDKSDERESPPVIKNGPFRSSGRKSGAASAKGSKIRGSTRSNKLYSETERQRRKGKAMRPKTLQLRNKENMGDCSAYENLESET